MRPLTASTAMSTGPEPTGTVATTDGLAAPTPVSRTASASRSAIMENDTLVRIVVAYLLNDPAELAMLYAEHYDSDLAGAPTPLIETFAYARSLHLGRRKFSTWSGSVADGGGGY